MPKSPETVARCARSPFKNVRMHALELLVSEGHARIADILLPLLQDPEQEVQVEAVRVAGVLECKEALPILLRLLQSADEPVALQAAVSLGELGHYGEVEPEPPPAPDPSKPRQEPMSAPLFYLLFAILSAGLFMSGYLFHAELAEPPEDEPENSGTHDSFSRG